MATTKPLLAALMAAGLLVACSSTDENAAATGAGGAAGLGGAGGLGSGTVRPGSQEDLVANVGDRVFFDTDRSSIRADQRTVLERQARWLGQYPQVQVMVEGHADERGTREYNLALGQRRANAARDVLVASGASGARVQTISYGKDRPDALGSSEEAWAQNRRAVTVVR
ncbi:peptidoglycan-associated lipoprotein Pal [Sabulicella glaciei]|uniref:Peptidoglycan-associated lipoprotein n=1 Tax=Sabulicella glaciei TaxID=2984948 RepID=A0ABT3P267_9PROT|nr:peptidoglycan-associated lipoprotein Pal [Roseococcus sp. MDT2-1-1]MCW8088504.1 peptidoglycan-associated lipoprotein Pal [Roseococcus sp. MDT2-1-1]